MRDAPDNYLSNPTSNTLLNPDNIPDIYYIKTLSFNDQKQPLLDEDLSNHIQFDIKGNLSYLPISISLTLKRKRHTYYVLMDFEKLTLESLIDTGAMRSATSEQDLNKIKILAKEASKKEAGPSPNFQILVANVKLEVLFGTVLLEFKVADFKLGEKIVIMKNLPNPRIGLCFL